MDIKLASTLFYAGVFDSSYKFPGISVTENRKVVQFELEIFTESGGTAHINGSKQMIRPGLVLCARPGDIRHTELPTRCYYVKISSELTYISEILEKLERFSKIQSAEHCASLIKDMFDTKAEQDPLFKTARLLELLSVILEENARYSRLDGTSHTKKLEAVELAIEYMEAHFREKCTLDDIAKHSHFSSVYFHGLFREAVGKTPFEYLNCLRLEEAKRLLLTQNLDISEISELCGFSSQSYFNYVFKKETGMTPTAYRRKSIAKYCT